jgi:hypothetical protein
MRFFKGIVQGVREVNRKYAKPGIPMTRGVKAALLMLRIYLFVLIGVLVVKFILTVAGK